MGGCYPEALTLTDDLVLVLVDGWWDNTYLGGIFAFTPGPLGWKRVNLSPKVVKQVVTLARTHSSSDRAQAARDAALAITRKKAWDLAAKERKAGKRSFVNPHHPETVVRFTEAECACVVGRTFDSQADMVRFLLSERGQ